MAGSFGSVFYREMPITRYQKGWGETQWQGSDALTLPPGAHALHYGSTCFEGLKAFRQANGDAVIFRLDDHIRRLQGSAQRLYLPVPDAEQARAMIVELVRRSALGDALPPEPNSLYLRPIVLGDDPVIGKAGSPSETALFYVLGSPVGDYFTPGTPLKILVESVHERCAPHMGMAKSGGNYASALYWQMQASQQYGAQQVLFCPQGDVQETGASNFIFIEGDTLITKPLTTEFLHGITRDTVLKIAPSLGLKVKEESFTAERLKDAIQNGAEAALTGTAAVIAPVTAFQFGDEEVAVAHSEKSLAIRKAILDVQFGHSPDVHAWLTRVAL